MMEYLGYILLGFAAVYFVAAMVSVVLFLYIADFI
jgi:hypothetical protein